MHEQLKQIGNLKRKMRGLSLRGFIHHLVTDRTLDYDDSLAIMVSDCHFLSLR